VKKLVDDFFAQCDSPACLPMDGMPLLAYAGINQTTNSLASNRRARLLQHLLTDEQQQFKGRRRIKGGISSSMQHSGKSAADS
jgi:hypothetical protein